MFSNRPGEGGGRMNDTFMKIKREGGGRDEDLPSKEEASRLRRKSAFLDVFDGQPT